MAPVLSTNLSDPTLFCVGVWVCVFLSNYFVVLFFKKRTPRVRERDLPVDMTDDLKTRGERRDVME